MLTCPDCPISCTFCNVESPGGENNSKREISRKELAKFIQNRHVEEDV